MCHHEILETLVKKEWGDPSADFDEIMQEYHARGMILVVGYDHIGPLLARFYQSKEEAETKVTVLKESCPNSKFAVYA